MSHGGGLHGFVSYLMRLPKENFTVALLVNCSPPRPGVDPGGLSREIAELYLGEKLEPRQAPKLYDAYVGRYDYGGSKAIMSITREGDRLFAQLTGQPKLEIFPKSESEFFWTVVNAQVTFVKDESGKVTKVIHQQADRKFDAPRVE